VKEKLRVGGWYICDEEVFQVISVEDGDLLRIYTHKHDRMEEGYASDSLMEDEFYICSPVIRELYEK
jgi:hypothetical protein